LEIHEANLGKGTIEEVKKFIDSNPEGGKELNSK